MTIYFLGFLVVKYLEKGKKSRLLHLLSAPSGSSLEYYFLNSTPYYLKMFWQFWKNIWKFVGGFLKFLGKMRESHKMILVTVHDIPQGIY